MTSHEIFCVKNPGERYGWLIVRMAVMEMGRVVGFCIYCRDEIYVGNRYSIEKDNNTLYI